MKKFKLFLFLLTGFMTSCMNDDMCEDFGSQEYEHYLLQKSEEFAKKYNVEVHLDEDRIKEIAKYLTVEQMEEDYKSFSQQTTACSIKKDESVKGKLAIRKRVQFSETTHVPAGEINGSCTFYGGDIMVYFDLSLKWNDWGLTNGGIYSSTDGRHYGVIPWLATFSFDAAGKLERADGTATIQIIEGNYRYTIILDVIYRKNRESIWSASLLAKKRF